MSYEGVVNDPLIDPAFDRGHDEITFSIRDNLSNLNLFEYAHALPELYPLVENGFVTPSEWKRFIDSLESKVKAHVMDTIRPYWGVDYLGIIPIQSQFFLATLNKNEKLNKVYPNAFKILKENTSPMDNLGYAIDHFDSLLVFSEVVGETNFWYFFQIYSCDFVENVIANDEEKISKYKAMTASMELTSTYKIPLYLQIRKWNNLQNRLKNSGVKLCIEGYLPLEKISIRIEDNNKEFFKEALKDGIDRDKTKSF